MAWVTQACDMGHEHEVMACDICKAVVPPDSAEGRYIATWPSKQGTAGRGIPRDGNPILVCGTKCMSRISLAEEYYPKRAS